MIRELDIWKKGKGDHRKLPFNSWLKSVNKHLSSVPSMENLLLKKKKGKNIIVRIK